MDRFRLMSTFVCVVANGSFSRAARELGVTRALVSKRIQNLETLLEVKLLNRDTHRLGVTSAGRQYYESARIILEDVRRLEDGLSRARGAPFGQISVLCSKTFGETILAPLIASFSMLYSDVVIDITMKDTMDHSSALLSGGYDMALSTLPANDTQLTVRKLAPMPRVLVASPEYLAREKIPKTAEDLRGANCLDPIGAPHYDWTFARGTPRVVRVSGSPRANSSSVVCQAALRGLGIARVRRYLVEHHIARQELVEVLPHLGITSNDVYVLCQRDRYLPLRVKLFIEYLGDNVTRTMREMAPAQARPEKLKSAKV